jgi:hypothetical protein
MSATAREASRDVRSSSSVASHAAMSAGTSGSYGCPCPRRRAHRRTSRAHRLDGSGLTATSSSANGGGGGGGGGGTGSPPKRSTRNLTGNSKTWTAVRNATFSAFRIHDSMSDSLARVVSHRTAEADRKGQRARRIGRRVQTAVPFPPI